MAATFELFHERRPQGNSLRETPVRALLSIESLMTHVQIFASRKQNMQQFELF